jgi:formylglycine-generating enzyme required for sulfatase activity
MGSPNNEEGRFPDETQHRVTLSQGFWMLETQVTQEMWQGIMRNNPIDSMPQTSNPGNSRGGKLPVVWVPWDEIQEYIKKLNDLGVAPSGFQFSLPTEAQWEYACRAGTTTAFHFGNTLGRPQANFGGAVGRTTAGGIYPANAWGLYNMHGNVWEWCLDGYGDYPSGSVTDPIGDPSGTFRVIRGGCLNRSVKYLRSASRHFQVPSGGETNGRFSNIGFRLTLVSTDAPQRTVTRAVTPQPPTTVAGNRTAGERVVLRIIGTEYPFRWCPPGTFTMGSPASEQGRDGNERQHQVTLSRGFWMLETTVTQDMWEGVVRNNPIEMMQAILEQQRINPSDYKGGKLPVIPVSWDTAQGFIQRLNGLGVAPAGYRFSLPTEAQWEYACRAGTTTAFHFGNTLGRTQANFGRNVGKTMVAGSYPANAWGLFDMHGNVAEWCLDWFGEYPSGNVTDPTGASAGERRVLRGGNFMLGAEQNRSAARQSSAPGFHGLVMGLRLVLVRDE